MDGESATNVCTHKGVEMSASRQQAEDDDAEPQLAMMYCCADILEYASVNYSQTAAPLCHTAPGQPSGIS